MATTVIPVSKRGGSVKLGDLITDGATQFEVEVDADGVFTLRPIVTISAAELKRLQGGNGHSDPANPSNSDL